MKTYIEIIIKVLNNMIGSPLLLKKLTKRWLPEGVSNHKLSKKLCFKTFYNIRVFIQNGVWSDIFLSKWCFVFCCCKFLIVVKFWQSGVECVGTLKKSGNPEIKRREKDKSGGELHHVPTGTVSVKSVTTVSNGRNYEIVSSDKRS